MPADYALEGLVYVTTQQLRQSSQPLPCTGPEGLQVHIQPFIASYLLICGDEIYYNNGMLKFTYLLPHL